MTPKEKILEAAFFIARYAPKKRSDCDNAEIPWLPVEQISKALDELGVDPHHQDFSANLKKLLRSE